MHRINLILIFLFWPWHAFGVTLSGIDVLSKNNYKQLKGQRIGLITNHTGLNRKGTSTVDLFFRSKKVNLVKIFSPEHGFRGKIQDGERVSDGVDPNTGLTIHSLYGETKRPTSEMLKGIDTLVYDIQDVGVRFYTYITTMAMAMEEAAKHNIQFVVLDRPNLIRGDIFEGDLLDSDVKRFTGYFPIPTRYGLTPGELARWYNETFQIGANLKVIPLSGWRRHNWGTQTGTTFVPPSPNIRSLSSAILYPGIGAFEATNISVGRGTETPFELFGAPWINAEALLAHLREKNLYGILFDAVEFAPKSSIYEDELCFGIKMTITNRNKARPFEVFLASFLFLLENHPDDFKPIWEEVRVVTGSRRLEEAAREKISYRTLLDQYAKTRSEFLTKISPYYLYK